MQFTWTSDGYKPWAQEDRNDLLKLELPLLDSAQKNIGTLFIEKDVRRDPISHYTLRRIEHLRRTLTAALSRILAEEPGRVSLSGGL